MDERLKAFLAKGTEYEIDGQKIKLMPFKGEQIDLFANLSEKPSGEEIRKLVAEALTTSGIPTTIEDTKELPMSFINKISECILDVNGYNIDK